MTDRLQPIRPERRVCASHLARKAVVYVRQSTPGQVERNRESTALQYGLRERAVLLGWSPVRVEINDRDLGQSGQSGAREGFMQLVAEVGLGRVGIVIGYEVSRLSRCLADWGRLLDLCSRTDTLIADAETLYDLALSNDRFLLGIKGTMSEAELHILRQRMHAGREAKAARGELEATLPRGYVRDARRRVVFDPDIGVQKSVREVFRRFAGSGSLSALTRGLHDDGLRLPVRPSSGPNRGELEWRRASTASLYDMLTHPIYAGAYAWGRIRGAGPDTPIEGRWRHLLRDRHPAYIDWVQFELNLRQLASNRFPVRGKGPGLLSGLLRCGRCRQRMTIHYRDSGESARYSCRGERDYGGAACQSLSAGRLDGFVSEAMVSVLSPLSTELSLDAVANAEADRACLHEQWRLRVARAEQKAGAARRAYGKVDPGNRLVAQTLENDWEAALRDLDRLRQDYRRFCDATPRELSDTDRVRIRTAIAGISELWASGVIDKSAKAEIVRLAVEQITATVIGDSERVKVEIHWHGGHRSRGEIHRPVRKLQQLSRYAELKARVLELHAQGLDKPAIAKRLNAEQWTPARGDRFTPGAVQSLLKHGGPDQPTQPQEPRDRRVHEWTLDELSAKTSIPTMTLYGWLRRQKLAARKELQGQGRKNPRWLIRAEPSVLREMRAWHALPALEKHRSGLPNFRSAVVDR